MRLRKQDQERWQRMSPETAEQQRFVKLRWPSSSGEPLILAGDRLSASRTHCSSAPWPRRMKSAGRQPDFTATSSRQSGPPGQNDNPRRGGIPESATLETGYES